MISRVRQLWTDTERLCVSRCLAELRGRWYQAPKRPRERHCRWKVGAVSPDSRLLPRLRCPGCPPSSEAAQIGAWTKQSTVSLIAAWRERHRAEAHHHQLLLNNPINPPHSPRTRSVFSYSTDLIVSSPFQPTLSPPPCLETTTTTIPSLCTIDCC